jgi:hypothetical protein
MPAKRKLNNFELKERRIQVRSATANGGLV